MASRMEVSVLMSLQDKLTRPLRGVSRGFHRMGQQLQQARQQFQQLNNQMEKAGQKAFKTASKMTRRFTLPIVAAGGAMLKSTVDFNKGMANIATLIPKNQKRLDELSESILNLSKKTGQSTDDLANGMYQLVSAFGDSGDSAKNLEIAVRAAMAGASSTTDAINLLSAVTKGYGDTSSKAMSQVSDLAFQTVKLGQTTFPELARSMGMVVPMAKALNVSQQELFAGFATLTGVTGSTSEVATQLRGTLSALIKPSTAMKNTIAALGYTSADAMLQQLGMVGALRKLIGTTGGSKEKMAALFGQVESLNAVMALTGSQSKVFDEKLKAMRNTAGATADAFDAQTSGINKAGYSFKKMTATVKVMAIKIGRLLLPILESVSNALSSVADFVMGLPKPIQKLLLVFGGLMAAIGPIYAIVGAFQKLRVMLQIVKVGVGLFAKAMMMNPMILKFVAIAAGIAAIVAMFKKTSISVKDNVRVSKELSGEIDRLASAYDAAAGGAKKLTDMQKAQMRLNMLTVYEKMMKEIQSNYDKQIQLEQKLSTVKKGTLEEQKTSAQLAVLTERQKINISSFQRSAKYIGRADEASSMISGMQQSFYRQSSGTDSATQLAYKIQAANMEFQRKQNEFTQKLLTEPQKLNGTIKIDITTPAGMTGTGTGTFNGQPALTPLTQFSRAKNGGTR